MNIHRKKKKFCCICRKHFFDWIKFSRYGKMQITAKRRHERTGDFMTMKTKRGLAVGGGTVLCAALAILIATRFAPEPEASVNHVTLAEEQKLHAALLRHTSEPQSKRKLRLFRGNR